MKLWKHQEDTLVKTRKLASEGATRIGVALPCGAGKTKIMLEIAQAAVAKGKTVAIYSCRRSNTKQIMDIAASTGITTGVVASEFGRDANSAAPLQVCQMQTVAARIGDYRHPFPYSDVVIVDEAHQQTGSQAKRVLDKHAAGGSIILGFTATPVNMGGIYDHLVCEATYQQLLDCKAHLPVHCFGPDRPNLDRLKTNSDGEFSQQVNVKLNEPKKIFGTVFENWKRLNPQGLSTIGFAPGVAESRYFHKQFIANGIPSAHIDGSRVSIATKDGSGIINDVEYHSNAESREAVFEASRNGDIAIIWNRFVLREAIDLPHVYCCILACSMGARSTYLQSAGRVLRYHKDLDHTILIDHGGNIDRHGFPAQEQDWELGCTNRSVQAKEKERRQATKGADAEPIFCPKCDAARSHGDKCHNCGWMHKMSIRKVRELDGTVLVKKGRSVKHKPKKNFDGILRGRLYAAYRVGHSVKQAYTCAVAEANSKDVVPIARSLRVPPAGSPDWHKPVRQIYPTFKPKGMR